MLVGPPVQNRARTGRFRPRFGPWSAARPGAGAGTGATVNLELMLERRAIRQRSERVGPLDGVDA
jgi:hypothetical protein